MVMKESLFLPTSDVLERGCRQGDKFLTRLRENESRD